MANIKQHLALTPTPIAGLALGIGSLGISWQFVLPDSLTLQLTTACIASGLILLLLTKFVLYPRLLLADLKHPLVSSVLPTSTMAVMVVSVSVQLYSLWLAGLLWMLATGIHLCFLLAFVYFRRRDFEMAHMVPSWFIPPIGIIVAAVSCPSVDYFPVASVLLWFGLASYALLLPVMLYRLIFGSPVAETAKPTLAVLAAPASLSLLGYLTITPQPSAILVAILLSIALLMTSLIYLALFHLLRQPFSPGFAAFTFPLVIGASALFKVSDCCSIWPVTQGLGQVLQQLAIVELIIATLIVTYVTVVFVRQGKNIYRIIPAS